MSCNVRCLVGGLARVYFVTGNLNKAIELEAKAVEQAKGPAKDEFQETLDEYKELKANKE